MKIFVALRQRQNSLAVVDLCPFVFEGLMYAVEIRYGRVEGIGALEAQSVPGLRVAKGFSSMAPTCLTNRLHELPVEMSRDLLPNEPEIDAGSERTLHPSCQD